MNDRSRVRFHPVNFEDGPALSSGEEGWKLIPYRKLLRWLSIAVGIVTLLAVLCGSFVGWRSYRSMAVPHRAHIATAKELKNGTAAVRPYFGPAGSQAIQQHVALLATFWFKDGRPANLTRPEYANHDLNWEWYEASYSNSRGDYALGDYGQRSASRLKEDPPWTSIASVEMQLPDVTTHKQEIFDIKIPGSIVHALATNPWARLLVTLALEGNDKAEPQTSHAAVYATLRQEELYGSRATWPPGKASTGASPVSRFLQGSSVAHTLSVARENINRWHDLSNDGTDFDRDEFIFTTFLTGRTWLVSAKDFPTYFLNSYQQASRDLSGERQECRNASQSEHWWAGMRSCARDFQRSGHFENTINLRGTSDQHSQDDWRYGPYLTTALTTAPASEYVALPKASTLNGTKPEDVADVNLRWHLAYSALAPATMQLAHQAVEADKYRWGADSWGLQDFNAMLSPHLVALGTDRAELLHALAGHEFNPGSHPILRTMIGALSTAFLYGAGFLTLLYWQTRRFSTGIAIGFFTFETVTALLDQITQQVFVEDVRVLWLVATCAFLVFIGLKQLKLWSRVEVTSAGGWVPTAYRVRPRNSGEVQNRNLRKQQDYRLHLLVFFVAFALLRAGIVPPPLVQGSDLQDFSTMSMRIDHNTGIAYRPWFGWLSMRKSAEALNSSAWLTARFVQIRLNAKEGTFAGLYPIGSYCSLAAAIASSIPVVFHTWFGRSAAMSSFGAWDVIRLGVEIVLAWQARRLPQVLQSGK